MQIFGHFFIQFCSGRSVGVPICSSCSSIPSIRRSTTSIMLLGRHHRSATCEQRFHVVHQILWSHLSEVGFVLLVVQNRFDIGRVFVRVFSRSSIAEMSSDGSEVARSVEQRIKYKLAMCVFKSRINHLPVYLSSDLVEYSSSRPMRSMRKNTYKIPRVRTEIVKRGFQYAGPRNWNDLPDGIRSITSLPLFRKQLKTYLFNECFNWL